MKTIIFLALMAFVACTTTFANTAVADSTTLPPEVEVVAQKLGFSISIQGRNPGNGGLDIYVKCDPFEGGQSMSGVDQFDFTDSTFTLIRNVDMFDYWGASSEDESDPKNIIDKTTYVFEKNSVKRVVIHKDGSSTEEVVLTPEKIQIQIQMGPGK